MVAAARADATRQVGVGQAAIRLELAEDRVVDLVTCGVYRPEARCAVIFGCAADTEDLQSDAHPGVDASAPAGQPASDARAGRRSSARPASRSRAATLAAEAGSRRASPLPEACVPLLALGSVRWRKVVRDLREHRVRSVLVVLSIAVGVMAVGTIAGANALLERNLANGYAATKPSSASLFTTVPFDQGLVDVVRGMPDVAEAEGRRSATARMVKTDGETVELALTALPDYEAQSMDLVSPESGTWPPKRGEIVFERSSRTVADLAGGPHDHGPAGAGQDEDARHRRLRARARRGAGVLLRPADRLRHLRHPRGPGLRRLLQRAADPGGGPRRDAGPGARGGGRGSGPPREGRRARRVRPGPDARRAPGPGRPQRRVPDPGRDRRAEPRRVRVPGDQHHLRDHLASRPARSG